MPAPRPSTTPPDKLPYPTLAVMGGGNMARAIIRGGLDAGVLVPQRVCVCEPVAEKQALFPSWGVRATASHAEALAGSAVVLLAVKPQSLDELAGQIRAALAGPAPLVISILAGTPTARLSNLLGSSIPIVRAMPNMPASIRLGMSALCAGSGATAEHLSLARRLLSAVGETVEIDESLMDAFTAVAGSGPAYVFHLAEAMTVAAREVGFNAATADMIVRQTIRGSGELLAVNPESPTALRAAVTSKGGTTAAATEVLEAERVAQTIIKAIVAARDRGRELAG